VLSQYLEPDFAMRLLDGRWPDAIRGHHWINGPGKRLPWHQHSSFAPGVLRDGQWSLRALDLSGGEQVITPPAPPRVFVRYPDWSARGELVVFERSEMTGNIWLMNHSKSDDK
jgi:hypothetical protein